MIIATIFLMCVIIIVAVLTVKLTFSENNYTVENLHKRKKLCGILSILCAVMVVLLIWQDLTNFGIFYYGFLAVFSAFLFIAFSQKLKIKN